MKTILIPTDFKSETFNCVPELLKRTYPDKLNIILIHVLDITDSIQELLMLSRRSAEYRHVPEAFYKLGAKLKSNYPDRINNIRIEFFYGSTVAIFNNLLDANNIDAVVKLNNYQYEELTQNSIDPSVLMSRCNRPVMHLDCKPVFEYALPKPQLQPIEELVENEVQI
jgi:hypothetical protein